jgi:F-box/leucine-rich repeat protein 2/20
VTDEVLLAVGERCAKLERLAIFSSMSNANTSSVTDVGVSAVLQGCPLLCNVDVQYAGGIGTELRVELARRCNFTTLTLCHWDNMSEELAQGLLTVSPNLTALDCGDCFWLTDATLAVCAQHCSLLESISIKRCHEVTTAGVTALVSKVGHNLSTVNLEDCFRLGDEAVVAIAEHCPQLTQIMCPSTVSAAALATLIRSCPLRFWVGEL